MIRYEEALATCQTDPESAAQMLCAMALELDQLKAEMATLTADNAALQCAYQALRDKAKALKERSAKNSRNSSKPPSSDGLAKPRPKSLRPPSDRPTGGQPGHPGHTLRMVESPDHSIRYTVESCSDCGGSLALQAADRVVRRQVFDLPEPKLEVTEHQAEVKTCSCGCVNRAAFPPEVAAPVQYGFRVKTTAVYLKDYQLLPFDRLSEIMRDLFACNTFSEGTLANFSAACAQQLELADRSVRDLAAKAPVVGFDETGLRALGRLYWLHTVSTPTLTWYFAHERRGREAMDSADILPNFKGCAVHDFWSPYLKYDCDHAFCNAHLLRELVFLWEVQGQEWAKNMIDHLLAIKTAVDTALTSGIATIRDSDIDRFHGRYLKILEVGYAQNPPAEPTPGPKRRGRPKQSKALNLLDRLRNHSDGVLAFMRDFSVPFDNNQPERDLRMMKLRQKISGTFRSLSALEGFCRIRGYVSTARKNGVNALEALRRAFAGDPFIPLA